MRLAVQSLAASALLFASTALAAEPAHNYRAATATLATAQSALEKTQASFRTCQNGKLQLEFGASLARLEAARRTLEKGRRETEAFRRKLEATRQRLEAGHRSKHDSAAEREAKERHYLERLEQDYVAPLSRLAGLVEQYSAGITGYANVLDQYATFCAQPGYTNAAGRSFVSGLSPAIDDVNAKAAKLLSDASGSVAGDVSSK